MDPISTAASIIKYGLQALQFAKAQGYLGGSTEWLSYAEEVAGLLERGQGVIRTLMGDPALYDSLAALPPEQLEAEIRTRVYPTPLQDLVNRVKGEMGLA